MQKFTNAQHIDNFRKLLTNDPVYQNPGKLESTGGDGTRRVDIVNGREFKDIYYYMRYLMAVMELSWGDVKAKLLDEVPQGQQGEVTKLLRDTYDESQDPEAKLRERFADLVEELQIYCLKRGSSFSYLYFTDHFVDNDKEGISTLILSRLADVLDDPKDLRKRLSGLLNIIKEERRVDQIGALAGFEPGLVETCDGGSFLVTKGAPRRIQPKEGNCDLVLGWIYSLFTLDQLPNLFGWLSQVAKRFYASDRETQNYMTQVGIFLGAPGVGKSTLQEVFITALVGGRSSDVKSILTGSSEFNAGRAKAEHLILGDCSIPGNASPESVSERLTDRCKVISANLSYALHQKFCDEITVANRNVLTISSNLEDSNLRVLPDFLNESLRGKLQVFLVERTQHAFDMDQWQEMMKQLPAFVNWLLFGDIDGWLKEHQLCSDFANRGDERFGIKGHIPDHIIDAQSEAKNSLKSGDISYLPREVEYFKLAVDWLLVNATELTGKNAVATSDIPHLFEKYLKLSKEVSDAFKKCNGVLERHTSRRKKSVSGYVSALSDEYPEYRKDNNVRCISKGAVVRGLKKNVQRGDAW